LPADVHLAASAARANAKTSAPDTRPDGIAIRSFEVGRYLWNAAKQFDGFGYVTNTLRMGCAYERGEKYGRY
jgi:hypothetical protein